MKSRVTTQIPVNWQTTLLKGLLFAVVEILRAMSRQCNDEQTVTVTIFRGTRHSSWSQNATMRRTMALLALLHHVQSFAPHYTRSLDSTLYCQILGMNCASATQFAWNWWPDFCQRGGATDVHADGWGLAYYLQQGLREFHDTEAASTSALAQFLGQQRPITTTTMLAHIRYATTGSADNLANVHPFSRE